MSRLFRFVMKRGPEGVRRAMRLFGVRGIRGKAECCVLANYLKQTCPGFKVHVGSYVLLNDSPIPAVDVTTPDLLCQFIDRFDRGQYPELVG